MESSRSDGFKVCFGSICRFLPVWFLFVAGRRDSKNAVPGIPGSADRRFFVGRKVVGLRVVRRLVR